MAQTTIESFLKNEQVYGVSYEPVASRTLTDTDKSAYSALRIQAGQFGLQACFLLAGHGPNARTRLLTLDRKSTLTTPGDYPIAKVQVVLNEYAQMDRHTVCIEASK